MAKIKTTAQNNHNIGNASTIQVMQLFFRLIFKFTASQDRDWNQIKDLQRGRFIEVINPSLQRIWCQGFNSTCTKQLEVGSSFEKSDCVYCLAICAHSALDGKGLYLMPGNWYPSSWSLIIINIIITIILIIIMISWFANYSCLLWSVFVSCRFFRGIRKILMII